MSVGVNAVLAQAKRAAQRRGQRASTAHVLLVVLQSGGRLGELLSQHGLNESQLLAAVSDFDAESDATLERALERAQTLATRYGAASASTWHLLLALTRDGRSAAHRCFALAGSPNRIRDALVDQFAREGDSARGDSTWGDSLSRQGDRGSKPQRRPPTGPGSRGFQRRAEDHERSRDHEKSRQLGLKTARRLPTPTRGRFAPSPGRGEAGGKTRPGTLRGVRPLPANDVGLSEVAQARDAHHREAPEMAKSPEPESPEPESREPKSRERPKSAAPPRNRSKRKSKRPSARRDPNAAPIRRDSDSLVEAPAPLTPVGPRAQLDPQCFPLLCSLGRNLTELAFAGSLDPVIGRDREIETILDVLSRRRANNPVLVGPPGVGKTAVVEGVAQQLAKEATPRALIELSAGTLVSGTGVRGALADRISILRDEVARSAGRVVVFIDEIHGVVGGGDGPDDLASQLKTALARGELPCIGATTDVEFRKYFERDAALVRRFTPVRIEEPSQDDAVAIIQGLVPRYSDHHGVPIEHTAVAAAVELSKRYIPQRFLPDKAISVLDLAAARVQRRCGASVTVAAVADVVAEQAGVPVERLTMSDGERLLRLEKSLAERVVGHEELMQRIANALRKSAAGFRGERPLGTFLFLGPTGVGKTETAKAISEVFFAGSPMTRLDMSEFGEAHAVARLLGAPPGYVGHEDGGQLTEAVRKRPYQLVLLDEIEKAHSDVLLALLPLLDEGVMTDGRGRRVDFRNTIIVMTSNLGAQVSVRKSIGFGAAVERSEAEGVSAQPSIDAARQALPPEFWNRIDEPLAFGPLTRDDAAAIAHRCLAGVARRLQESGITLSYDAGVVAALLEKGGFDPQLGARPMRRVVGRLVESMLASALLSGAISPGQGVRLVVKGDQIAIASAVPAVEKCAAP